MADSSSHQGNTLWTLGDNLSVSVFCLVVGFFPQNVHLGFISMESEVCQDKGKYCVPEFWPQHTDERYPWQAPKPRRWKVLESLKVYTLL